MALLITPDGTETEVTARDSIFTLDEMYSLLHCSMIQAVFLHDGRIMWIDEEGKLKPHRLNLQATVLLHEAGGMAQDYIAGAALVTSEDEVE